MIPGPPLIIACPYCGFLAKKPTILSSYFGGGTLWSDGKREGAMPPEFPAVVKCRGCGRFYWVAEAEVKGKVDIGDRSKPVPEEWERAEYIKFLTIDEYIEALGKGVGSNKERGKYLRVHFWWAVNDLIRRDPTARIPRRYVQELRDNLIKLSSLLDEGDLNERIMKAEIAREMGNFDEALRLLNEFPSEVVPLRKVADQIAELARRGNTLVTKLVEDRS